MGIKDLAEAIILQTIEDLWDAGQRPACLKFFNGEGFDILAGIAGITLTDCLKLREMINGLMQLEPWNAKNIQRGETIEHSVGRG